MSTSDTKIFELYKRFDALPLSILQYEHENISKVRQSINNCLNIKSPTDRRVTPEDLARTNDHFKHCVWSKPECEDGPDTCPCALFDLWVLQEFENIIIKMESFK